MQETWNSKISFFILKQVQVTWNIKAHLQHLACAPVLSTCGVTSTCGGDYKPAETIPKNTLLLPPFHLVKALFAGKIIHLDIGHRHLKENLPARKHAITFTCYVCKKGQSSNKNRYTGERAQGKGHHNKYNSHKEIWASSSICIPSKRSAQTWNLKPHTSVCLLCSISNKVLQGENCVDKAGNKTIRCLG